MILQPLAENAVQHGMIAPGKAQGTVTVSSAAADGRLVLTVMDDGAGMDGETLARYNSSVALHDDGTHNHIGSTNVLRRLNMIYHREDGEGAGVAARFENRPEGGLKITIDIPLTLSGRQESGQI
jgi:two-component system sensor histidine kinase YesM